MDINYQQYMYTSYSQATKAIGKLPEIFGTLPVVPDIQTSNLDFVLHP